MPSQQPRLLASGLKKRYGAIQALNDVSISLSAGEVHALVGSNGAGKSTLVKILTGAITPDEGTLELNGAPLAFGNTRAMLDAGIACIYQQAHLVPEMTVIDNIVLGRHPTHALGFLDRKAQRTRVAELLERHNLPLPLDTPVKALSSVQQKEVEIAKALSLDAAVILMDEPTAALSHSEVVNLFHSIRQLSAQGVAILYISHILDEIFAISQQVTVLRDGQVRLSVATDELTKPRLVDAMLGRELSMEARSATQTATSARAVALECRALTKANVFSDIDLQVYDGEIVCITGLVGAKRTELVRAIFGADPFDSGEIRVHGQTVNIRHPLDAIRLGMGFVSEDRHTDGLFMEHSIIRNTVMAFLERVTRGMVVLPRRMQSTTSAQIKRLEIVPPLPGYAVKNLSGGNQQKVQLARWMVGNTRILILDEPTVGVDISTKATLYRLLRELAGQGTAIIIVSSDMEEVLTIADRIIVMANGRITGTFTHAEVTQDHILTAASGE